MAGTVEDKKKKRPGGFGALRKQWSEKALKNTPSGVKPKKDPDNEYDVVYSRLRIPSFRRRNGTSRGNKKVGSRKKNHDSGLWSKRKPRLPFDEKVQDEDEKKKDDLLVIPSTPKAPAARSGQEFHGARDFSASTLLLSPSNDSTAYVTNDEQDGNDEHIAIENNDVRSASLMRGELDSSNDQGENAVDKETTEEKVDVALVKEEGKTGPQYPDIGAEKQKEVEEDAGSQCSEVSSLNSAEIGEIDNDENNVIATQNNRWEESGLSFADVNLQNDPRAQFTMNHRSSQNASPSWLNDSCVSFAPEVHEQKWMNDSCVSFTPEDCVDDSDDSDGEDGKKEGNVNWMNDSLVSIAPDDFRESSNFLTGTINGGGNNVGKTLRSSLLMSVCEKNSLRFSDDDPDADSAYVENDGVSLSDKSIDNDDDETKEKK